MYAKKNVVLRFVSDAGGFFGTLMDENDAKEIIKAIREGRIPDNMLVAPDYSWVVSLDKVWCAHTMDVEALKKQQEEQQRQQSPPLWNPRSGGEA